MKRVILFDADGVVIQTELFSVQYGKEVGVVQEEFTPFFKGIFQECLVGKADLKEIIKPFLAKWKWTDGVDAYLLRWFKAEHHVDQQLLDYIKKLRQRGILCFVATNQDKYRLEYLRTKMNFNNLFDGIYCSCEIGSKKPEPAFYEYILQDLAKRGIGKDEILFVDDTPTHAEGAKQAGIEDYLYKNCEEFKGKKLKFKT